MDERAAGSKNLLRKRIREPPLRKRNAQSVPRKEKSARGPLKDAEGKLSLLALSPLKIQWETALNLQKEGRSGGSKEEEKKETQERRSYKHNAMFKKVRSLPGAGERKDQQGVKKSQKSRNQGKGRAK